MRKRHEGAVILQRWQHLKHGVVLRVNNKTASGRADEGKNCKVSLGLLRKTTTL